MYFYFCTNPNSEAPDPSKFVDRIQRASDLVISSSVSLIRPLEVLLKRET